MQKSCFMSIQRNKKHWKRGNIFSFGKIRINILLEIFLMFWDFKFGKWPSSKIKRGYFEISTTTLIKFEYCVDVAAQILFSKMFMFKRLSIYIWQIKNISASIEIILIKCLKSNKFTPDYWISVYSEFFTFILMFILKIVWINI